MAGANIGCMYEELLTNRRRAPGHSQAKLQLSGNRRPESVGTGRGSETCTIQQQHDSDGCYAFDLGRGRNQNSHKIGRASWRGSVCKYVLISVISGSLKKKSETDKNK